MGITEKIKDIEAEMARTQKNKATEHHLGMPILTQFYLLSCIAQPKTKNTGISSFVC